jgi:hypothetical protein
MPKLGRCSRLQAKGLSTVGLVRPLACRSGQIRLQQTMNNTITCSHITLLTGGNWSHAVDAGLVVGQHDCWFVRSDDRTCINAMVHEFILLLHLVVF